MLKKRVKAVIAFFSILILLTGSYFSVKYFIYYKINKQFPSSIKFSQLKLGVFPLRVIIEDVENFPLQDKNLVSFKKVSLEIPISSVFSTLEINVNINKPNLSFNQDLFDLFKKSKKGGSSIKLNRANIKHGELNLEYKKYFVTLLDFELQSFKKLKGTVFKLKSPHLKVVFRISGSGEEVKLEGSLESEFKQFEGGIKINKLLWETEHFIVNINGQFFKDKTFALNTNLQGNPEQILYPILKSLTIRSFLYGNAEIVKDLQGKVYVKGRFKSNSFTMGGESFGELSGGAEWDFQSKQIKIIGAFNDGVLNSSFNINARGKKVKVKIRNVCSEKAAKVISIYKYAPLECIVKQATVQIHGGNVTGTAELIKNQTEDIQGFNVSGNVQVQYNAKTKWVKFESDDVFSEFGRATLFGEYIPQAKELFIKVRSNVSDLGGANKYSKFYLDLDWDDWKLKGGTSIFHLDFRKKNKNFHVDASLDLKNFHSNDQKLSSLKGRIYTRGNVTRGDLVVNDKQLKCEVELFTDKKVTQLTFKKVRGESQKMIRLIPYFDLDIKGYSTGKFQFIKEKKAPVQLVIGSFKAKKINFYGFNFDNVSGDLETRDDVRVRNLKYEYYNGKGIADIYINFQDTYYNIKGNIHNIDVNKINHSFKGKGEITFNGVGKFEVDPIKVDYKLKDLFFYEDRKFEAEGSADVFTDFTDFRIMARGNILNDVSSSPFLLELTQEKNRYLGDFNVGVKDINLLVPWGNSQGEMDVNGRIFDKENGSIEVQGIASIKGRILSFPRFPHELNNYSGLIFFNGLNFELRSITGTMGGGEVKSNGHLIVKDNAVEDLLINIEGKNMMLYPMDRTNFVLNADLNLKYKKNGNPLLSGELTFLEGLWERGLEETDISFNTNPSLSSSSSKWLENLHLDLKLTGRENFRINNSFVDAKGKFNLRLSGHIDSPIFTGTIESNEGQLFVSDKKFNLIKARINFNNQFLIDPIVNIESETFIQNYRIKFNIKGLFSHLKPEFISSPPMPPQDIIALITLGELFKRPTSTGLSSQIGTTGLFTTALTEDLLKIQDNAKKYLGIDLVKFNPEVPGTAVEGGSRLTLGKLISKDFLIVYSKNLSTSQPDVYYFQYQLSPTISVLGMRNEEGRLSIDIRFRKRY